MNILVTGAAGFIGSYLVQSLLKRGDNVIGVDNINDYYDVNIKYKRLEKAGIFNENFNSGSLLNSNKFKNYKFIKTELENREELNKIFETEQIDKVCNLAAQAGVRYSIINPHAYINSNIVGYFNLLELSKQFKVKHFVYASSSSVYGLNSKIPFSTSDNVDHPVSLYAATKKSNELMAHSYSHLNNLPTTGLRYFTVYGPWDRPDMAYFSFTKAILEGKPINVYNNGKMKRDFTYIDDIIEGTMMVLDNPPVGNIEWNGNKPDPSSSKAPYKIYNIGSNCPVLLEDFIDAIEKVLGKKAKKNYLPMQPGDLEATYANFEGLAHIFNYKPKISIKEGLKKFIEWYRSYYSIVLR